MAADLSFLLTVDRGRDGMQISSKSSDGSLGTLEDRQLLKPLWPHLGGFGFRVCCRQEPPCPLPSLELISSALRSMDH